MGFGSLWVEFSKLAWVACVAGCSFKALSWVLSAAAPLGSSLFEARRACSLQACANAFGPMLVPSVAFLRDRKITTSKMLGYAVLLSAS